MMEPDEYSPTKLRSVWCKPAQFARKVEDELYRSRRYDVSVCLVFVNFPMTFSHKAAREVAAFVGRGLRRLDFAGVVGDGDYAICLPHTDRDGTGAVVSRLLLLTASFPIRIGVASHPEDGATFGELVATAKRRAELRLGIAA